MRLIIHAGPASGRDFISTEMEIGWSADSFGNVSFHIYTLADAYALQRASLASLDALKAMQGEQIAAQVGALVRDAFDTAGELA